MEPTDQRRYTLFRDEECAHDRTSPKFDGSGEPVGFECEDCAEVFTK